MVDMHTPGKFLNKTGNFDIMVDIYLRVRVITLAPTAPKNSKLHC